MIALRTVGFDSSPRRKALPLTGQIRGETHISSDFCPYTLVLYRSSSSPSMAPAAVALLFVANLQHHLVQDTISPLCMACSPRDAVLCWTRSCKPFMKETARYAAAASPQGRVPLAIYGGNRRSCATRRATREGDYDDELVTAGNEPRREGADIHP
jgi:hypothetical protein